MIEWKGRYDLAIRYLEKLADPKTFWSAVLFFSALFLLLPPSAREFVGWTFVDRWKGLIWFSLAASGFLLLMKIVPEGVRWFCSRPPALDTKNLTIEEKALLYTFIKIQFQDLRLKSDHPDVISLARRHLIEPASRQRLSYLDFFDFFRVTERGEKELLSKRLGTAICAELRDDERKVLKFVNGISRNRICTREDGSHWMVDRSERV